MPRPRGAPPPVPSNGASPDPNPGPFAWERRGAPPRTAHRRRVLELLGVDRAGGYHVPRWVSAARSARRRRDASAVHGVKARKDVHRRGCVEVRQKHAGAVAPGAVARFGVVSLVPHGGAPGSRLPSTAARARDVRPRAAHALRRAGRRAVAVGVRLAQLGVGPVRFRIRGRRRSAAHPEPRPWTPRAASASSDAARLAIVPAGALQRRLGRETTDATLTARRGCEGCSTVRDIRTLLRACVRRPSGRGFSRMFATECSPTEAADGDKAIRTDSLAFSENRET